MMVYGNGLRRTLIEFAKRLLDKSLSQLSVDASYNTVKILKSFKYVNILLLILSVFLTLVRKDRAAAKM